MWKALLTGAVGYPILELCWRGRTHWTMALAGAAGCAALRTIHRSGMPRAAGALMGAASIVLIEGSVGLLFNRDHRIWDYRGRRGNLGGQVCPAYAALWVLLSYGALAVMDAAER